MQPVGMFHLRQTRNNVAKHCNTLTSAGNINRASCLHQQEGGMPNEHWKLRGDLGRIVGLGVAALIAGWLYDPGICDDHRDVINADPIACLLDTDGCD
jgi:hypothetical protein